MDSATPKHVIDDFSLNILVFALMLLALIVSPILLLSVSAGVLLFEHKRAWKIAILGLSISFSLFAVHIDPNYGDLLRYYGILDVIEHFDLNQTIAYFNDGLLAENILLWAVAKTGKFFLLPAISTGVVYYVSMYITGKTAEYYDQTQNIKWIILLQIFLLPFTSIAHNVRNVLAFALLALALYRDVFMHKLNVATVILYVIASLMHTSAILLVLARLLMPIIKKSYTVIIVGILLSGVGLNIGYAYSDIFSGIPLVQKMIVKAYRYLSDSSTDYGQIVAASTLQNVLKILFVFLTLLIAFFLITASKKKDTCAYDKRHDNWNHLVFFTATFVLFCCFQYTTPMYWRFFIVISMALSTVILSNHTKDTKTVFSKKFLSISFFGAGIAFLDLFAAFSKYDIFNWMIQYTLNQPFSIFSLFE